MPQTSISVDMASSNSQQSLIAPIRTASRLMVRELGFMASTIAGTDHSPSAVHALIELGSSPTPLTASALSQVLNLEKSSVSRMVKKLVLADEIREDWSRDDAVCLYLPTLLALGLPSCSGVVTSLRLTCFPDRERKV